MFKFIFYYFITLSAVLACHPSCLCTTDSNICQTCIDPNSQIDSLMQSCPCNAGFYTNYLSTNLFACQQSLQPNPIEDSCKQEFIFKSNDIHIDTVCETITDAISNDITVTSTIYLDFTKVSLNQICKNEIEIEIQYFNILTQQFEDLPAEYLSEQIQGLKMISIPIQKFYNMSILTESNLKEFSNSLQIMVSIFYADTIIISNTQKIILQTNSQEMKIFSFQNDSLATNGCNTPLEDCIVIEDFTTNGFICTNQDCTAQLTNPVYSIGDYLYGKVSFVNSSLKMKLIVTSFLLQIDSGFVVNLTSIAQVIQIDSGFVFKVQQIYAAKQGYLQINMNIQTNSRFRTLLTDSTQPLRTKKNTFRLEIQEAKSNMSSDYMLNQFLAIIMISFFI